MNTIQFQYFPKNNQIPEYLQNIVNVFNTNSSSICSLHNELDSNTVLRIVSNGLISLGFEIERSKKREDKIQVPVLFGKNGKMEQSFDADGYHKEKKSSLRLKQGVL